VTHYFTGEIVGAESAFVYRIGTNHSDYHNASYVPYFLDEINNQTLLDEAVLVCGDASRVQCIFDYIFMDRRTAEQTLKLDKEQQVTSGELGMLLTYMRNIVNRLNHSVNGKNSIVLNNYMSSSLVIPQLYSAINAILYLKVACTSTIF